MSMNRMLSLVALSFTAALGVHLVFAAQRAAVEADDPAQSKGDSVVVVPGPTPTSTPAATPTATPTTFPPATGPGTWSPTGDLATGRWDHTATLMQGGQVLLVGGLVFGIDSTTSTELYEPSTETFVSSGEMVSARDHHQATLLGDGNVLVSGGYSTLSDVDYIGIGVLPSAEL